MNQVIAIVRPHVSEQVVDALRRAPIEALAVREVKGYGRQKDNLAGYEEGEFSLAFLPKVEISLWVDDARLAEVVEKIRAVAETGRMGDGKIFVLPCQPAARVIELAAAAKQAPPPKPSKPSRK